MDNHIVTIDNRERIKITDIDEMDGFDEKEIKMRLKKGDMILRGEKMHIQTLDLQEGEAVITGRIDSLIYVKSKQKGEKGLVAKIMK